MSGKTFYFCSTEQVDYIARVFDYTKTGFWYGSLDEFPVDSVSQKFQYFKYVIANTKDGKRIIFGILQMNCRKTEESLKSYLAGNFGIFKISVLRLLVPLILCHLKIHYILEKFSENTDE